MIDWLELAETPILASRQQLAKMVLEQNRTGIGKQVICKWHNVESRKELTKDQASTVINYLVSLPNMTLVTGPQLSKLSILAQSKGVDLTEEAKKLGKADITELTKDEASQLINKLLSFNILSEEKINNSNNHHEN